ncbi:hypothetical protein [Rubellimicrobium roseum]|uniref:Phasin family protein n=1 Tax=Rubellimicrobium roseum TaxID=687525 RepID=A0A5C4N6M0_9RHOB|nr:hypothetical protein [Rubellimicrobium roseum]TNC62061.1 hypothetical protein FHG71_20490 [Rubellimicrobium roseum]
MSIAQEAWTELMKAGFGLVSTSLQVSEMMVASSSVIGARMTIMGQAARRPAERDYAEITGMVAEKVVAVSKVNQALVDQWSAMLLDASEQAHHLGCHALSGRPLSARDYSSLIEHWLAHGTRMVTRTMGAGGLALAPVHQQATANARRLGR